MTATCPQCAGLGSLLGRLGALIWYRCRSCGWDFQTDPGNLQSFETLNSEAGLRFFGHKVQAGPGRPRKGNDHDKF